MAARVPATASLRSLREAAVWCQEGRVCLGLLVVVLCHLGAGTEGPQGGIRLKLRSQVSDLAAGCSGCWLSM